MANSDRFGLRVVEVDPHDDSHLPLGGQDLIHRALEVLERTSLDSHPEYAVEKTPV